MKACEDILKRAIALLSFCDRCCLEEEVINGRAFTRDEREKQRTVILNWINKAKYISYLTEEEIGIINTSINNSPNYLIRKELGRYESIEPLLWAVGLQNKISKYDTFISTDFHGVLQVGLSKLTEVCNLRNSEEITKARETAMLWNWRSKLGNKNIGQDISEVISSIFGYEIGRDVNIELTSNYPRDFVALSKPYYQLTKSNIVMLEQIAISRQHALQWITCEEDWDDVDLSV